MTVAKTTNEVRSRTLPAMKMAAERSICRRRMASMMVDFSINQRRTIVNGIVCPVCVWYMMRRIEVSGFAKSCRFRIKIVVLSVQAIFLKRDPLNKMKKIGPRVRDC